MKKFNKLLAYLALVTGLSAPIKAQDFDLYSHTQKYQSQNNLILKGRDFRFGFNNVVTSDKNPKNVLALEMKNNKSKFFLHHTKDNLEAKINQRIGNSTFSFGAGDDLTFFALEKGFLQPFGYGFGFVDKGSKKEFRYQVWNRFDKVFTGVRKSDDKYFTVISLEDDVSARYFGINSDDFRMNQLIVGKSREGYYNLKFKDSWFLLHDSALFGGESFTSGVVPFDYIVPPIAWRFKDGGLELKKTKKGNSSVSQAEAVKYLDNKLWIGFSASDDCDYGFSLGSTSEKSNWALKYNFKDKSADIQYRVKF